MIYCSFNWGRIKEDFVSHFERTFTTNKKAHFDSVPPQLRVVDGAKLRWCNLILMDAVIYLLELKEINEGSRRSFNQQKVLIECIVAELQRSNIQQYHQYQDRDENFAFDMEIQLEGLLYPWHDAARLRETIIADPTTKSREKFVNIVDSLFYHPVLAPFHCDLGAIFRQVITKVLQQYPVCSAPTRPEISSTRAPTPQPVSQDSRSFHASLFDDIAESELDSQSWNVLDEWMSYTSDAESSSVSASPVVMSPCAPASVPVCERPAHPLPVPEVGYNNLSGAPLVHVNQHYLSEFRPIDHTSAERDASATNAFADICRPTPAMAVRAPLVICTTAALGPFPEPMPSSMFSRRVSFMPITPAPSPCTVPDLRKHGSAASMISARTDTSCSTPSNVGRSAVVSAANSPTFPVHTATAANAGSVPGTDRVYWECATDDSLDFDIDLEGLAECCSSFDSNSDDELGVLFLPIQETSQGASRKRSAQFPDELEGPVRCKPRHVVHE